MDEYTETQAQKETHFMAGLGTDKNKRSRYEVSIRRKKLNDFLILILPI